MGSSIDSHGAFNRTRIIINADELDSNLTSTREAIKESLPYSLLKEYIKKKFNNEVRAYYFDEANKEAEKKQYHIASPRLLIQHLSVLSIKLYKIFIQDE